MSRVLRCVWYILSGQRRRDRRAVRRGAAFAWMLDRVAAADPDFDRMLIRDWRAGKWPNLYAVLRNAAEAKRRLTDRR